MKRYALLAIGVVASLCAAAQNDAVTTAYMDMKNGQLDNARKEIEKAAANPKTSGNAKTWYFRGNIYTEIAQSVIPALKALDSNANRLAYDSFKKAIELDKKDGEYSKNGKTGIDATFNRSFNDGVLAYQNKQYARAARQWELANEINPKDTTVLLYLAYDYDALKQYDKVKATYGKLFEQGRRTPDMYKTLASYERAGGNDAKALEIVREGLKYYPNDKTLAIEELSLISNAGQLGESKDKLENAIKMDPTNASLYLALGSTLDKESADSKKTAAEKAALKKQALVNYEKVLELDPNNVDANFNVGVANFNEGVNITKKVNNMDMKTYTAQGKKLEAEAKVWYQKALPYFEKVYSIQPNDPLIKESLRKTYMNLGRKADADKIPADAPKGSK